jgi:hypothetical protein
VFKDQHHHSSLRISILTSNHGFDCTAHNWAH